MSSVKFLVTSPTKLLFLSTLLSFIIICLYEKIISIDMEELFFNMLMMYNKGSSKSGDS